ncbi:MAG: hypothetical protein WCY09_09715 [Candidatus Omnitrophota bacterium]
MEHKESEKWRNTKQWKSVLSQWSKGLTFEQTGRLNGITRQRCHQIVRQAKKYVDKYDDDLAKFIKERIDERIDYV